jgi:isopenicillin N synthase-like dioxygenase
MSGALVGPGMGRPALAAHPIDLTPYWEGGPGERRTLAGEVDRACRDTGFLLLTGHRVPQDVMQRLLDTWSGFFDLPDEEKSRWIVADPAANRGYTALGREALAYSRGEVTPPDLFEAFTVGREDTVGPYYDAYRDYFALNTWPEQPAGLRDAWLAYEAAVSRTANVVLRAMALGLGLSESWLTDRVPRAVVTTRALHYERRAGAPDPEPGQQRLGAHTDYGIITLLLADDVPGLQVHRDGAWHDVVVPPGALLCNIGDLLAQWTNDRWRSTLHRVVPPSGTSTGDPLRRRSVARFLDCEPDMVIECIPSCCSPENPPRYPPVVAGEWLMAKVLAGTERRPADLPV